MKSKRNMIIAFLLCATLIVGVGYAAVAEQLTVDGTASYNTSPITGLEGVIHFTGNTTIVNAEYNAVADNGVLLNNNLTEKHAVIDLALNVTTVCNGTVGNLGVFAVVGRNLISYRRVYRS